MKKSKRSRIKKTFEGYMNIDELKKLNYMEGLLLIPHMCRVMPYDYEKKVKVTLEEL